MELIRSNSFFRTSDDFRNPRDEALVQNSLGSGVIVTNEGHIITNNHVVADRQGRSRRSN